MLQGAAKLTELRTLHLPFGGPGWPDPAKGLLKEWFPGRVTHCHGPPRQGYVRPPELPSESGGDTALGKTIKRSSC